MNLARLLIASLLLLLVACDKPPPPEPPPEPPKPKWNAPPPAAPLSVVPVADAEPEGPSLAKLGLDDPLVKLAAHEHCREAVGGSAATLPPSSIYLQDAEQNKIVRRLIQALPKLRALMPEEKKKPAEVKAARADLEKNLAAIEKQIQSLGKLAPMQLQLDRGATLARLGKTAEAREVFHPLFAKKMYTAADHGLLGTCLLPAKHWPERLRWDPWSDEELPTITPLARDPSPNAGLEGIEVALGALDAEDLATVRRLNDEVRRTIAGLTHRDEQPVLSWALLSVLVRAFPTEPALWEWRGVVAQRLGEPGVSRADLVRGCFLGGETACVLAWWAKSGKSIAIAGDGKHYWPLEPAAAAK